MIHTHRTCRNECAVSPVVGVMLMLVVVIIIAAVVSGFAGGMMGESNKKAPTLSMDVKVVNTGTWHGSGFSATVNSVSEPIPTKNLKIVTSYSAQTSQNAQMLRNMPASFSGGATVIPNNGSNLKVLFDPAESLNGTYVAPFGIGPGVNGTELLGSMDNDYSLPQQQFGNYSLIAGTNLIAFPCGASDSTNFTNSSGTNAANGYGTKLKLYNPSSGGGFGNYHYSNAYNSTTHKYADIGYPDAVSAVLGSNWNYLQWGNTVNIKVIHIPTGTVIFNQDVPVTEQ